ncbi:NLR family CARD domain-containing protein 3-like [Dermacentor albipictus]|uniref:NLR family CARD domain-containing protein 3-like n=1 Tax=Dermacentor albipictus TaxID=60249 RepID=UPI0038FCC942
MHCHRIDVARNSPWQDQLDLERKCDAVDAGQKCWLSADLTAWNQVMHRLAFELVETRPGRLRLSSIPRGKAGGDTTAAARQASFLVSRLLARHCCIDEFGVTCAVPCGRPLEETPFPIRLRPPSAQGAKRSIRWLEIEERPTAALVVQDIDAITDLVTVRISARAVRAEFAAEVEKLLRRNAGSIKSVDISDMNRLPRNIIRALECLVKCESLSLSSVMDFVRGLPDVEAVAQLVRTSTALKELTVDPVMETQISATAKALECSATLTKLTLFIPDSVTLPKGLFPALEVNTVLKELWLTGFCCIDEQCGQAMASALRNNTCLRHIHIEDVQMDYSSMAEWPDALSKNSALECFQLSSEQLPLNGISALCRILPTNKVLKKLVFAGFRASQEERVFLAEQLTESKCYGRVQLPWVDLDLVGLGAALNCPSECPEELYLPDICQLSEASLRPLCEALASSKRVRLFSFAVQGHTEGRGAALCEMLKANRSIKRLLLNMADDRDATFSRDVFHALAANRSITHLVFRLDKVQSLETATAFSYMLAHNSTATSVSLWFATDLHAQFIEQVSSGMSRNKVIVELKLMTDLVTCDTTSFPVFESLRRNKSALNRATEFVLTHRADKQLAEDFEHFLGRPCLLAHLVEVTGKTEPEALVDVTSAQHFLEDNYLVLTGIVKHSVVCRPAETTQLDALNRHCWRAVVRHLKVADVLTEASDITAS